MIDYIVDQWPWLLLFGVLMALAYAFGGEIGQILVRALLLAQ